MSRAAASGEFDEHSHFGVLIFRRGRIEMPFGIIAWRVIKLSPPHESARLGNNADEQWRATGDAPDHSVAGSWYDALQGGES